MTAANGGQPKQCRTAATYIGYVAIARPWCSVVSVLLTFSTLYRSCNLFPEPKMRHII